VTPAEEIDALSKKAAESHRSGKLEEALAGFTAAGRLAPDNPSFWNARATLLAEMGRLDDAAHLLVEAEQATHDAPSVLVNRAVLLERMGRHTESIEVAKQLLEADQDNPVALQTLGIALLKSGRPAEAAPHFRQLAALHPEKADTFLNLGETLLASDDYQAACAAYRQSLVLSPSNIAARIGLGQALAMLKDFALANSLFTQARQLDPDETDACFKRMAQSTGQRILPGWKVKGEEVYLSRHWGQQQVCDWHNRDGYQQELLRYAQLLGTGKSAAYDRSLAFQSLGIRLPVAEKQSLLDGIARGIATSIPHPAKQRRLRKVGPLRVGFLSAGVHDHPSAQLHWRHLSLYDRDRFRIHAYSLSRANQRTDEASLNLRNRVIKSVDHFTDLAHATVDEAIWRVSRDSIDILVDLAGFIDDARPEILMARPAPIRVSYHGSLLSMGNQLIDYKVTDCVASPDAAEFTEALAYLPVSHYMYNDAEPIDDRIPSRSECGLPDVGFVFCAFNSAFKIEPDVFGVWMRLLDDLPGSVLWLSDGGNAMRDNLRHEAQIRGIPAERLVFAPRIGRAAHLARHSCADLFLDTFICNAHTTAADALWAGLPVLTRAGNTMASRLAASLITAAGLPELVARSTEEYLALALNLARSTQKLGELRNRLKAGRGGSRLFATQRRVEHLSKAYEIMWEKHCRGEQPTTFEVTDSYSRP
jgi:predicted O-linked N-acetylglucosamine transferase (SPINDLY family)